MIAQIHQLGHDIVSHKAGHLGRAMVDICTPIKPFLLIGIHSFYVNQKSNNVNQAIFLGGAENDLHQAHDHHRIPDMDVIVGIVFQGFAEPLHILLWEAP